MVCFHILLAYPVNPKESANQVFFKQLAHLCKGLNADLTYWYETNDVIYIRVAVCDTEAVTLLRDIPSPVYCVSVSLSQKNQPLYKFYKVLQEEVRPPRDLLLKRVYWTASQLEPRWRFAS
jgi:hypothetical protein